MAKKKKRPKAVLLDTHITIHLRDAYWGAYKRYGWEDRIEGLGVRIGLVWTAEMSKKKILFRFKYGDYEITTRKIRKLVAEYNSMFTARDGTEIVVVPRSACKKIEVIDAKV